MSMVVFFLALMFCLLYRSQKSSLMLTSTVFCQSSDDSRIRYAHDISEVEWFERACLTSADFASYMFKARSVAKPTPTYQDPIPIFVPSRRGTSFRGDWCQTGEAFTLSQVYRMQAAQPQNSSADSSRLSESHLTTTLHALCL
ncbi:hypothetical protein BDV97DRAFT_108946 [Delphinella strobiligena]|nr:hypothetical protein BDV97DRAFT_108946 [Delphinella strobiligena]